MSPRPYLTLGKEASDQFIVNKSRFIGLAAPLDTQEAALAFIDKVREEHRGASHHCFAYIIGRNAGIMRYQDDGEPSGTAGQPIIEVMKARQLVNACVVVVRYFGGVLLGAGGLTRAYSKGAAVAIEASGVVSMEPSIALQVEVPYPLWDRLQHRLTSLPVLQGDSEYGTSVITQLMVRAADMDMLEESLMSISDGKAFLLETDRSYYAWPEPDKA